MDEPWGDPWFWQNLWEDVNTVDLGELVWLATLWGYHLTLRPPQGNEAPQITLRCARWVDAPMYFWVTDTNVIDDIAAALREVNPGDVDIALAAVQARYNP